MQTAAKSFLGRAIIFKSNAVELFARFGVPLFTPSILVFKDFGDQPWATYPLEPTATVSNVPSAGATPSASDGRGRNLGMVPRLTKWIDSNSLALMPELSAENYQAVFKPQDRKLVVLACIAGQKPLNSLMLKDELKSWAKQWRKSQQARDVKVPVDWVWTNATQWAGWLSVGLQSFIFHMFCRLVNMLPTDDWWDDPGHVRSSRVSRRRRHAPSESDHRSGSIEEWVLWYSGKLGEDHVEPYVRFPNTLGYRIGKSRSKAFWVLD